MNVSKPNIFLIITDQQRFDSIGALGFPHMITPHLDRLCSEGIVFSNCSITAPSCAPSRASLFTGQYPHCNGVQKNADLWSKSWVENLTAAGYCTVNVGKMHTMPFTVPCGFQQRYVVENKDRYLEGRYFFDEWDKALAARGLVKQQREFYRKRDNYGDSLGAFTWDLPSEMHSDHFTGGMARWWMENHPATEPLFLQIGFPGPHPPYDPTPEALTLYRETDFPLAEVSPSDLDGQPAAYRNMRIHNCEVDHDSVVHLLEPSEEQRLTQRRHYCANVSMIDQEVGKILQTAEEQGYLDNAIVVFSSDHGDCLTDHGHSQKWTMYDQVMRVPLIVWSPNGFFEKGRTIDQAVSLFDLSSTILQWAGSETPAHFSAQSLLPALTGDSDWKGRDFVYAEQCRDGNFTTADYQLMTKNAEWKLIEIFGSHGVENGRDGLFIDLQNDPEEKKNLYHDSDYKEAIEELRESLLNWRVSTSLNIGGQRFQ